MKCINCGSENAADTKYCASCSHEQNTAMETADPPAPEESLPVPPAAATPSDAPPVKPMEPTPNYNATVQPVKPMESTPNYNVAAQPVKPAQSTAPIAQAYTPTVHPSSTSYPQYTQAAQQPRAQPQYSRPTAPQYQQPYNQYPTYPPYNATRREKQTFTITDAYIIIGFVLAIVGVFVYSFVLLPASIGFSVVGFVKRTNTRTLGLSIAGIVVGVVAILIRVAGMLTDLGLIPEWLSAGIFY